MQTIPTPTTRTRTYESGETAQFTDWTIGAYALRKTEEPGYTGWAVLTADRDLPRVENENPGPTPKFGVSCYSNSGMNPAGAAAYAAQIMAAAQAAMTFNMIVAAN